MNYLLCCDLNTLNCSAKKFEALISQQVYRYLKLSDNIWLFKCDKNKYATSFVSVPEYLVSNVFEDLCDENGCIFITEIKDQKHDYFLPERALDFLESDNDIDD